MAAENESAIEKPEGIVVLDTERSGDLKKDCIVAIGFCHFPVKNPGTYKRSNFVSRKFVLNLHRQPDETYEELWQRHGFSMECFHNFFVKIDVLPMLERLQRHSSARQISTPHDLAIEINHYLTELNGIYKSIRICVDTADTDRTAVSKLLQKYNFPILCYDRATGMKFTNSGILTAEIIRTLHATEPTEITKDEFLKTKIFPLRPFVVEHDHDPEHDALNIAATYIALQKYIAKIQEERKRSIRSSPSSVGHTLPYIDPFEGHQYRHMGD
jgi:hypothetical protein